MTQIVNVVTLQENTKIATCMNIIVLRLLIHTGMTVSGTLKIVGVIMAAPLTIVMKQKAMIRSQMKMKLISLSGCTVIIHMAKIHLLSVETLQVNTMTVTSMTLDVIM